MLQKYFYEGKYFYREDNDSALLPAHFRAQAFIKTFFFHAH